MKKSVRLLALFLALVMCFSGLLNVQAAPPAQEEIDVENALPDALRAVAKDRIRKVSGNDVEVTVDYYIYPSADTNDATVVKGKSTTLLFYRDIPEYEDYIYYGVSIFRGGIDALNKQLERGQDPEPIDTFLRHSYEYSGSLSFNWTADSKYPVGDYSMMCFMYDAQKDEILTDLDIFFTELHVVSEPRPATGISLWSMQVDGWYEVPENCVYQIPPLGRHYFLPQLMPIPTTDKPNFKVSTNSDVLFASTAVELIHGYIKVDRVGGIARFVLTSGNKKFSFWIKDVSYDETQELYIQQEETTLCAGQTSKLTIKTKHGNATSGLCPVWESMDPSIATVDMNTGVVTALRTGTVKIKATVGAFTQTVEYTVSNHVFAEGTPVSKRTATQPAQSVGHCIVCGQDNCVAVYEEPIFVDTVPNAWYASSVDFVYENGIMNGTSEDTFAPNMPMSRAMVATVLYRVAGSPKSEGEIPFSDTVEGSWYADAVRWAAGEGIVNGFTDGTFRPELDITREQFATILYRYSKNAGMDMSATADLSVFPDSGNTSAFAVDAMRWAVGTGLITGVASGGRTELRPLDNATRVQFATVISRYMAMNEDYSPKTQTLGDFEYCALPDGTVRLCGYLGSDEAPEIPAEIDGKPVTAIAKSAFAGNLTVKTLEIPENVTKIGDYAFECCPALESVSFPASLREVGMGAFSGCVKLATVEVPEGVEKFGDGAFFFCKKLSDFAFPGSVREVGDYMFAECSSLSKVTFKEGLPEVSERMFWGCASLRSAMLPESVKSIGALAFAKCEMLSEFAIPAGVTEVGAYAFDGCGSLRSVTFPAKVLREATFRSCYGLESFTLGEGVETIEEGAFRGASFEGEFAIPASVTTIAPGAFNSFNAAGYNVAEKNPNYSSLDGVLFSKDMTKLLAYPAGRFEEHYEIPASVTTIGSYAFAGVFFLSELELPATVTTLEDDAFYLLVNLEEFTVPATVTSMGKRVFENMNARTVTLKNDLKTLPEGTFLNSNSENVILPDGLESIGPDAFLCANGLIELTLPKGLREIADGALLGTSCTFVSESPNFKAEGYQLLSADGKTLTFGAERGLQVILR